MHVIRLHGPWTAELASESRRVHLPRDWNELAEYSRSGPVTLVRRFHRPTGLGDTTRVRLAIPAGWPLAALRLNGEVLPSPSVAEQRRVFDLSSVILQREAHDLEIEFRAGDELVAQPYFVAIEIEEPE